MADTPFVSLSRRERQILEVLYRLGTGACADVVRQLPDQPAYNTVRVTLGILEKKGFVTHKEDGPRYVYAPVIPREKAKRAALSHLMRTFFAGSPGSAILTLLDMSSAKLSRDELDAIASQIAKARKETP